MKNLKEWEDVLRTLCKKGEIENATRILELLQRDFNEEEIALLREAAIKNKDTELKNALIKMGLVEDPIELSVSILKEEAKMYHTIGQSFRYLLQENPEKRKELMKAGEEILKIAVASGNYSGAKKLAEVLGRELQEDELETILKVSLEKGRLSDVEEITMKLNRMLTLDEVKVLIKAIREKWWFDIEANVAVKRLLLRLSFVPKEKVLKSRKILETAILTSRCTWLKISMIKGLVVNRVKIPKSIVKKVLKEALDNGVDYQDVKFLVEEVLERTLKPSEIKKLLKAKSKKGDVEGMIEIIKAHPEISPTKADLRRLCKAI